MNFITSNDILREFFWLIKLFFTIYRNSLQLRELQKHFVDFFN